MATTKISAQLTEFNPGDPDYVLNATNAVTVGSGPQYNFNGVYGKFGLRIGTTILTGVSSSHPFAVINNGKTSQISYTGTSSSGTGTGPDGNTYTFYYGDITITVTADFGTVSYYCLNHGYMGGQDNFVSVYSEAGLKMPTGNAAYAAPPAAEQGMMRNEVGQTSQGSGSTMQHYNGSQWKNFVNKEGAVSSNLLYEVKAGSLTDGSNTGPITWSDESGNGNDWLLGQAVMVGASAVNTFTVNKSANYFECASGSITSGATGTGVETVSAIDLTNDCTVEMWLYLTAYQTYTGGFITYDYSGTKNGMYGTLTMPTTYYQSLTVYTGNVGQATVSSNYATLLNTWYQHVFTIDDTNNEIKFYKNGVLQSTYSSAFTYTSANSNAALGYPDYGTDQPFAGRVGILRGYTAVLTPAQVLQNFDNDKGDYGL